MFLTVPSYHRTVESSPPPENLVPDPPAAGETPNILMCGGIDDRSGGDQDLYWFVETIVSRELLQRSFRIRSLTRWSTRTAPQQPTRHMAEEAGVPPKRL